MLLKGRSFFRLSPSRLAGGYFALCVLVLHEAKPPWPGDSGTSSWRRRPPGGRFGTENERQR